MDEGVHFWCRCFDMRDFYDEGAGRGGLGKCL